MLMNSESVARILCELPLDSELTDGIEAALANPQTNALLIEFNTRPDSEKIEVDQIPAGDPLIGRLRGLLRQMEQGLKPIVALVFESLDGLELEIALACHARFANSRTIKLGFPWLKYGLMPIVGGTQRLPRLCGIGLAARMLLQGERVVAAQGAAAGFIPFCAPRFPHTALTWTKPHPHTHPPPPQ